MANSKDVVVTGVNRPTVTGKVKAVDFAKEFAAAYKQQLLFIWHNYFTQIINIAFT